MFHYQAYGYALLSALPLGELDRVESGSRLPSIRIEEGHVVDPRASLRYECLWPSGARYFVSHGDGTRYVLTFPDVCDVAVDVDRRTVRVAAVPGVTAETIRHILLDQVVPRLLAAMGRTVLHASAVETPIGTVAFLGEGGAGKSTLAAAFSAAGDAFVCDDALVVEVIGGCAYATPGYPRLRLFPDGVHQFFERNDRAPLPHSSKKWCVRPPIVANRLTPLRHTFVLDSQSEGTVPRLKPLAATEAFFALVRESYRLDARTAEILTRDTNLYADVTSACPMSKLTVPDEIDRLSSLRDWLLAALERPAKCETATATR
jgi:hypothetical protein